jgi:protein TonB
MFDDLVISVAKRRPTYTLWAFLVSLAGQLSALGVLLMIPTIGIQALPSGWRGISLLPPPAPAAAPPVAQAATNNNQTPAQHVMTVAPFAPPHATIIHDPTPPAMAGDGGTLQLPGAIPGVGGDNPWSSILSAGSPGPPGVPVLSVGGQVQAAKLIHMVRPEYPLEARKAHLQGTVILEARIAKDGTVVALRYMNGPVSLLPAVVEAVSQWRYMPTLLNGQPMEVETTITVIFRLLPPKKAKHSAGQGSAKDDGRGR